MAWFFRLASRKKLSSHGLHVGDHHMPEIWTRAASQLTIHTISMDRNAVLFAPIQRIPYRELILDVEFAGA
jgi:hypothetical protein